jgi:hypothetical protein
MKTKIVSFLLLLALLFVPTASAHAQTPNGGDVFLLGQNYTLSSDQTLNGSLAVVGGNATIEKGAVVNGDVVLVGGNLTITGDVSGNVAIIGGNLTISGKIDGDIAVVGGQAVLTKTADVNGDIATVGGQVQKDPDAKVSGNIVNNAPLAAIPGIPKIPGVPNVPSVPNVPNVPAVPNAPDFSNVFNPLWGIVNVIWRALAIGAIAMLLALFLQPQLERVADAVTRQPLMAGSFGLLAVVATPLVMLIMIVTLILIPVAILVAFVVPLAWLFGMVAIGQEVGERFTKAINQTWAPVLSTGMGTFLLVLVGGFIGLIPCVGWLVPFLVGFIAVGGVAMTWFGTRSAPGSISGTTSGPVTPMVVEVPPAS